MHLLDYLFFLIKLYACETDILTQTLFTGLIETEQR